MGPEGRPAEVLLLQEKFDGYPGGPGGPGGPAVVQCTTVDMPPEPPRDYIIWSLISCFYSNPCCLGLVAIIHSYQAVKSCLSPTSGTGARFDSPHWAGLSLNRSRGGGGGGCCSSNQKSGETLALVLTDLDPALSKPSAPEPAQ
ncbi:dispanin subfamily A member 2b-like protein [Lates japonicus]|uniref:Dispanin subfamily A member 2b-like protein n=1 Tax=Lates japonicus TaxID=270547 RepID=A0AAD3RHJ1_LATJO|nr:dispanin subfamily A member 2b-like protein [Lates japonicus]